MFQDRHRGHRPAVGEPGHIVAGFRINLDQPFKGGIMLDIMVRGAIEPWPHVVIVRRDQPHDEPIDLGLASRWLCLRFGRRQQKSSSRDYTY